MAIDQSKLPATYSEAQARALAELYLSAIEQIKRTAERRLLRDARTLTAEARRSRAVLIEIEQILQLLDEEAAQAVSRLIPAAYRRGVLRANQGLESIGFSTQRFPIDNQFHGTAVELLAEDIRDDLLEATANVHKQFRRAIRRTQLPRELDIKITQEIGKGLIAGETRQQVQRALTRTILDDLAGKPLLINGRQYQVDKYAELVVRTKTREAVTKGTINRLVETGNDLVMVTRHGATDGCGFFEGRVFSISGTSSVYPPVASLPNGGPPFHPNCVHNLAPYVDELASGAERRRAEKIDSGARGLIDRQAEYKDFEKLAA
jgi:hypothetical protein